MVVLATLAALMRIVQAEDLHVQNQQVVKKGFVHLIQAAAAEFFEWSSQLMTFPGRFRGM